jgi:hydrogenase expression/formation protein HypC
VEPEEVSASGSVSPSWGTPLGVGPVASPPPGSDSSLVAGTLLGRHAVEILGPRGLVVLGLVVLRHRLSFVDSSLLASPYPVPAGNLDVAASGLWLEVARGYQKVVNPPTAVVLSRRGTPSVCLAIPGRIVELVDESNRLARVDVAGVQRSVNIGLLDSDGVGVGPGDWVLIHVGFAMSKVDEDEALETRRMLESMGDDYEQELEELKASVIE